MLHAWCSAGTLVFCTHHQRTCEKLIGVTLQQRHQTQIDRVGKFAIGQYLAANSEMVEVGLRNKCGNSSVELFSLCQIKRVKRTIVVDAFVVTVQANNFALNTLEQTENTSLQVATNIARRGAASDVSAILAPRYQCRTYTVKISVYIHGYFVASFPHFNETGGSVYVCIRKSTE